MTVEVFKVDGSQEDVVSQLSPPIKSLSSTDCLIFVDNSDLTIYIFLGSEIGVRSKFIAANHAQTLRHQSGLVLKVKTVDEYNPNREFQDFLSRTGIVEGAETKKADTSPRTTSVSSSTVKTIQENLFKKHNTLTSRSSEQQSETTKGLITPQISEPSTPTTTPSVDTNESQKKETATKYKTLALALLVKNFEQVKQRKMKETIVKSVSKDLALTFQQVSQATAQQIVKDILQLLLDNDFLSETDKSYAKKKEWSKKAVLSLFDT